jgi:hypothetical protein
MKSAKRLPKAISILFAIASWLTVLAALAILIVMMLDPHLLEHGDIRASFELAPKAGSMVIKAVKGDMTFTVATMHGTLTMKNGSVEMLRMLQRSALPLGLLFTVFLAVLFDLLRRLFRNVARGESFTKGTIRLVYVIGFSLVAYSLLSAATESWLLTQLATYFSQHATFADGMRIVVTDSGSSTAGGSIGSGNMFSFSVTDSENSPNDGGLALGNSVFFSGLLVLALAEVFRQGLALKRDSDLTI